MKFILKRQKLLLKIIGLVQLIGGIFGIGLMAYLMMHIETITGPTLLILLFGLSLYIYSIYCGKSLLFDRNKTKAIIVGIINQALQILQFGMFGYAFKYVSGFEFTVGIQNLSLKFNISAILSSFTMSINSQADFNLSINLMALAGAIILVEIYNNRNVVILENETIVENNDNDMGTFNNDKDQELTPANNL
ncbi:hypothetical protein FFF34_017345 [Inquilinus sp. KBS0705]|nr:hypothetical protein FFF34_017345 [Inquilinus sp. KBS0705]